MSTRLYYNARLSSSQPYQAAGDAPETMFAHFNDIRTQPIVSKANDYQLSIVRFTTTLQKIPLLLVEHPAQAGPTPTVTAYEFQISSGNTTVPAPVVWQCPAPQTQQIRGDAFDEYWWETSFEHFGVLVNEALSTAMAALILAVPALAGTPSPFFSYDSVSATWSLFMPSIALSPGLLVLSANSHAANLFGGFPMYAVGSSSTYNTILQRNESLVTYSSEPYVKRTQTPGSLVNWSPVRRFVFTSSSLPVVPEAVVPLSGIGNPNATMPVITDITPVLARGDELTFGTLEYTPSAEYRRISLISTADIYEVDFTVYWEDQLGNLHPHVLLENGFVSVKLLFEKLVK